MATVAKKLRQIGIIGYGNVGRNVANNLVFRQSILNPSSGSQESEYQLKLSCIFDKFKQIPSDTFPSEQNIKIASSLEELTSHSDIVVTCLPTPNDIKSLFDDDNLLSLMKQNDIWIDHTTTDYEQTISLSNKALNEYGIYTLEAPITGGISLLKQGLMTIYICGNYEKYKECEPLFQCSGRKLFYLGDIIGNATVTKVVSNMLASVNTVAMGEALMMAEKSGINLETFWEAIRFSAGNSFVWETEAPLVMNGSYDPDFTLELQCKDLELGHQICLKHKIPLELMGLTQQMYNRAKYKYGDNKPSSLPPKLIEDDLNTPLRNEKFENWGYSADTEKIDQSFVVVHDFDTKKKN